MTHYAAPIKAKFWTPGVVVLAVLMAAGAAAIVARYHEVTHSYLRDHHFNIWFTIIAVNDEKIEEILGQIRISLNLDESDILNLPVKRLFKLDARFRV